VAPLGVSRGVQMAQGAHLARLDQRHAKALVPDYRCAASVTAVG